MDNTFTIDASLFPKELQLLLACMRPDPDRSELARLSAEAEAIDWNHFIELAMHHRVYPLVYSSLSKLDMNSFPDAVMQKLYMEYSRNTFQMLRLTAEMEKLCRAMNEQGIRTMMLKGPALTHSLFGDLSLRTSKDLDILIPPQDVERTEALLFALGYQLSEDAPRVLNVLKWKTHHISFHHPHKHIQIEVHWRLNPDASGEPPFEELWERRQTSPLTNYPIYYLGEADLFMYLASHGARHAWFRLRWLCDIDRIARQIGGWDQIHVLMKRYECEAIGGQALLLAASLFGTPLHKLMQPLLAGEKPAQLAQGALIFIQEMVTLCPKPDRKELEIYYTRYMFSLMSFRQKAVYVAGKLYPSAFDAKLLPLPKSLHFLYFPLRPFLWFWRRVKQQEAGGMKQ
jgi:hypothetical protein